MSEVRYIIQQLDSSNYLLLVPLMKSCFGIEVSSEYFKWKYFNNPAGFCIGFLCIEKDTGKAVSFYGAIPQIYLVEGKEMKIYQGCDLMTDIEHRKKSLFPVLARECFEYLKRSNNYIMISIGGTPQSLPVLKYFGWRVLFYFRTYFKPRIFCFFYLLKKYPVNNFVIEEKLDSIQELLDKQIGLSAIRTSRRYTYYKWRISNPRYSYKIVTYRDENNVMGFVVYYILNSKIFLFDLFAVNNNIEQALFWYLSKIVIKNRYKGIIAFCQEESALGLQLKMNRFIYNPLTIGPLSTKSPFLIYSSESISDTLTMPKEWALTAYDYDAT